MEIRGSTSCITTIGEVGRNINAIHTSSEVCANAYLPTDLNSFVDKANYYSTHVVQNKHCALQENIVSKQLILYDQETTDQYAVDYKVLTV